MTKTTTTIECWAALSDYNLMGSNVSTIFLFKEKPVKKTTSWGTTWYAKKVEQYLSQNIEPEWMPLLTVENSPQKVRISVIVEPIE